MELKTILKKMVATLAFILFLGFIIQFVNPKLEKPCRVKKTESQKEITQTSKQTSIIINPDKYKRYEKE